MPFDIKNESEFIQACAANDLETVSRLLKENPSLANIPAKNGSYPLMFAAQYGHLGIATALVDQGADVNALTAKGSPEGTGVSALYYAISSKQWSLVDYLLKQGAKANTLITDGTHKGTSPLWFAAYHRQWDLVNRFIADKVNLEACPIDGKYKGFTTLWFAIYNLKWDIAKLLLSRGAAPSEATLQEGPDRGVSILWMATHNKQWDIAKLLLKKNFQNLESAPSEGKYKGVPALWFAAFHMKWDLAAYLLDKGAVATDRAPHGKESILTTAVLENNWDFIKLLINKKYNLLASMPPHYTEETIGKLYQKALKDHDARQQVLELHTSIPDDEPMETKPALEITSTTVPSTPAPLIETELEKTIRMLELQANQSSTSLEKRIRMLELQKTDAPPKPRKEKNKDKDKDKEKEKKSSKTKITEVVTLPQEAQQQEKHAEANTPVLSFDTLHEKIRDVQKTQNCLKTLSENRKVVSTEILNGIKSCTSQLSTICEKRYINDLLFNQRDLQTLSKINADIKQSGQTLLKALQDYLQLCYGLEGKSIKGLLTETAKQDLEATFKTFSLVSEALSAPQDDSKKSILIQAFQDVQEKWKLIETQQKDLENKIALLSDLNSKVQERVKKVAAYKKSSKPSTDETKKEITKLVTEITQLIQNINPAQETSATKTEKKEHSETNVHPVYFAQNPVKIKAKPDKPEVQPKQNLIPGKRKEERAAFIENKKNILSKLANEARQAVLKRKLIQATTGTLEKGLELRPERKVYEEHKNLQLQDKYSPRLCASLETLGLIISQLKEIPKSQQWSLKEMYALLGNLVETSELLKKETKDLHIQEVARRIRNVFCKKYELIGDNQTLLEIANTWYHFLIYPPLGFFESTPSILKHINSDAFKLLYKLGETLDTYKKITENTFDLNGIEKSIGSMTTFFNMQKQEETKSQAEIMNVSAAKFCIGVLGSALKRLRKAKKQKIPRAKQAFHDLEQTLQIYALEIEDRGVIARHPNIIEPVYVPPLDFRPLPEAHEPSVGEQVYRYLSELERGILVNDQKVTQTAHTNAIILINGLHEQFSPSEMHEIHNALESLQKRYENYDKTDWKPMLYIGACQDAFVNSGCAIKLKTQGSDINQARPRF